MVYWYYACISASLEPKRLPPNKHLVNERKRKHLVGAVLPVELFFLKILVC